MQLASKIPSLGGMVKECGNEAWSLFMVALFSAYDGSIEQISEDAESRCFMVADALRFLQCRWQCAEHAELLSWGVSLFMTAARAEFKKDGTIKRPPFPKPKDFHVQCHLKEPEPFLVWLRDLVQQDTIVLADKVEQMKKSTEFLQALVSDKEMLPSFRRFGALIFEGICMTRFCHVRMRHVMCYPV